jgi:hypothetical protein
VNEDILKEYSKWLLNYILEAIGKNDDRFYSYDIEACLVCLRYMIELGIFGVE